MKDNGRDSIGGCEFEEEDSGDVFPGEEDDGAENSDTDVQSMTPGSGPPMEEEQTPLGPNDKTTLIAQALARSHPRRSVSPASATGPPDGTDPMDIKVSTHWEANCGRLHHPAPCDTGPTAFDPSTMSRIG